MFRIINSCNPVNYIRSTVNSNSQLAGEVAPNISEHIAETNLLGQYIDNMALQNQINIIQNQLKHEYLSAGLGNYENMSVKD